MTKDELIKEIEEIADEAFEGNISAFTALAKILAKIRQYRR